MQLDEEIQFGEVEQASPQVALRPDQNKHYAVEAYEAPRDGELPIFVDLDVARDMEEHALSDTSVELGGVLLGGVYEDDEGRPFVVVTDSLRAQHYESTKGSFKFTHDTWSAITREREAFPAELAMVGWYHTHPDWGVFLSGMDMFICDNFFNKRLDVAYVIDPCRGDRGMFQWTGDERQRVRRTSGFFVTASRFRAAELEDYVAELSGKMPTTTRDRTTSGSYGAPVVHLHQPAAAAPPPWQAPLIVGMLAMQFCLLALIAWRLAAPAGGWLGSGGDDPVAAALEKLDERLADQSALSAAEERVRAKTEVLDQVSAELRGTRPGFVQDLQDKFDKSLRLDADVAARDAQIRQLLASVEQTSTRLRSVEATAKGDQEALKRDIAALESRLEKLTTENVSLTKMVAKTEKANKPADAAGDADGDAETPSNVWWYVAGGIAAAVVVIAGVWFGGKAWFEPEEQPDSPRQSDRPTDDRANERVTPDP
ncbi:MAG: Mov34/MPN/PAD-1 family protein [Pirellulaceae bacterium]